MDVDYRMVGCGGEGVLRRPVVGLDVERIELGVFRVVEG